MRLIQFALVGLVLLTLAWHGGSVITPVTAPSPQDVIVSKELTYLLSSCYGGRIRAVGLAGNLPDGLARTLSTEYMIPVVLIESTPSNATITWTKPLESRQALQIFIVEASTVDDLVSVIVITIHNTIWWNNMASFIILNRSPYCNEAINYLHGLWRNSVLNAKVICYHPIRGKRIIFNFNPYTTEAPSPWKRIGVFTATDGHPFAVFNQVLTNNETICDNLDFDKTKNLGGYEISIEGQPLGKTVRSEGNRNRNRYIHSRDRVWHIIFTSLKGKPKFTPFRGLEYPLTADLRQAGRLMHYVWGVDKTTYPHKHIGLILISKFRGHKTQLEKILGIIDVYSRYGMGVVYFVTLIFLKFFVGQALVPALLNLVRITCDSGFTNLTDTNAARIFLTCLLFFVVTMQGIYQGSLAALLTTQIPLRNIDVVKDVVDLDYTLYGNDYMVDIIRQYPELAGRFRTSDNYAETCIGHVMNESSAACLFLAEGPVLDLVEKFELHTSSEFIATFYSAFQIRWDWPPEERVNRILSTLVEADIVLPWDLKCKPLQLSDYKYDKDVKGNKDFKVIELHELSFAFVILAIGLTCATVVFVVEVAIAKI